MTGISLAPIAHVVGGRVPVTDDDWGAVEALIRLDSGLFTPDAVAELGSFSHLEVLFHFHRVTVDRIETGARHPRGNKNWPRVGIFAQRGKNRPNRLGISRCRLIHVDGLDIHVRGLDAVDGSPVLDIKPWMREFGPDGETFQPPWATQLMRGYF